MTPGYGICPEAVVIVEALAGTVVVRIVVIGLVGVDSLYIQQVGMTRVVANYEMDVVLVVIRVCEQCKIYARGPGRRHRDCGTRTPSALNQARAGICRTSRLLRSCYRSNRLHEPAP